MIDLLGKRVRILLPRMQYQRVQGEPIIVASFIRQNNNGTPSGLQLEIKLQGLISYS
jgi:hypothetical protein